MQAGGQFQVGGFSERNRVNPSTAKTSADPESDLRRELRLPIPPADPARRIGAGRIDESIPRQIARTASPKPLRRPLRGTAPHDPSSKNMSAKSRSKSLGAARDLDSEAAMVRRFAERIDHRQNVGPFEARLSPGNSIGDFPPIPVRRIVIACLGPLYASGSMARREKTAISGSRESPPLLEEIFRSQAQSDRRRRLSRQNAAPLSETSPSSGCPKAA